MSWNAHDYRYELTQLKCLTNLTLKHLESIKGEELPKDNEFMEILYTLLVCITDANDHMENLRDAIHLPNVYLE